MCNRNDYITVTIRPMLIAMALGWLLAACSSDDFIEYGEAALLPENALTVKPTICDDLTTRATDTDSDIEAGTPVDGRDELRENFFGSLDVFVKRHDDSDTQPWFKRYHLVAGEGNWITDPTRYDSKSLLNEAQQLLSENWSTAGFRPDEHYDIYATANNPKTAAGLAPGNLADLKALTTYDDQIFRYQWHGDGETDWSNYMKTDNNNQPKQFLMDGMIENWTVNPDQKQQEFDVSLRRAAAKIIVNIRYDGEHQTVLKQAEDAPEPEKDQYGKNVYTDLKSYLNFVGREPGSPRWKYVNFGRKTSDIAEGTYQLDMTDTESAQAALHTWEGNFTVNKNEDESVSNIDGTYTIVTYSYPTAWDDNNKKAPYILLSVAYTKKNDRSDTRINYYRIPVCDENRVTQLERNNIYIVDVNIASLGADNASFELEDEQLRIEYHVIPWTATNALADATNIKIVDTKYFMVTPTDYVLKGNDEQTVELDWYASVSTDDGRFVDIDPNSLTVTYVNYHGTTQNIRGTVTKSPTSPDGTQDITIHSQAPSNIANNEPVTITITPNGKIRITSEAMYNRAVKDISFTVRLLTTDFEQKITIRHFPLDNIQSIEGLWSSRWNASYEYTFDQATAESWGNYQTDEVQVSATDPYDRTEQGYVIDTIDGATFRAAVPAAQRNNIYNSQANSYAAADGYDYWGTEATSYEERRSNNDRYSQYDYYKYEHSGGIFGNYYYYYYNYTEHFRGQYGTRYYRTRYYHTSTAGSPSTGNWVDWENYTGNINSDANFRAKIYNGGVCKEINTNYTVGSTVGATLTNNHMYVIQITSSSDKYVIGKPTITDYQSQDKVVSPAFMLASQLGAVTTFSGTNAAYNAAVHCGTYMEVGTDGTRYVGWRLPTAEEINVIIGYQNGTYTANRTMVTVLSGQYYWALNGTTAYVSTGSQGTATNAYVRCVRDLTLEEIRKINKENHE